MRTARGTTLRSFLAPWAVAVLLLAGCAGQTGDGAGPASPDSAGEAPRLLVLPLNNLTADSERRFDAVGWTLELIDRLNRFDPETLAVMGADTTLRYQGEAPEVAELVDELGVDHVLEGAVRDDDGQLRVTFRLLDAEGAERMTESIEVPPDESPSMIDEIALRVAQAWSLELPVDAIGATGSPPEINGRRAYLRARAQFAEGGGSAATAVVEELGISLGSSPDYADGYRLRARTALRAPGPWTERFAVAREAVEMSVALEPDHPEVALLRGELALHGDWDPARAEDLYREAVDRMPGSPLAREGLARALAVLGRDEEALAQAERAVFLDPGSSRRMAEAGWLAYRLRRPEQAVRWCGSAVDLSTRDMAALRCQVVANIAVGDRVEAGRFARGVMLALRTREEELAQVADELTPEGEQFYFGWLRDRMSLAATSSGAVDNWYLARAQALAGQADVALTLLERARDDRSYFMPLTAIDPGFDSIREEPRFQAVIEGIGQGS